MSIRWHSANERLCIEVALDIMVGRGFIDPEYLDEDDEANIIRDLQRLYRKDPTGLVRVRIKFSDDVLHNALMSRPAEYLVRYWEVEQQFRWQREQATRFACHFCGTVVGVDDTWTKRPNFYSLNAKGEWMEQIRSCPGCGRSIATVRREGPLQPKLFEAESWRPS